MCHKVSFGFTDTGDLDTLRNKINNRVPISILEANTEKIIDKKQEYLRVCKDSKLVLKAPKKNLNQIVFWECPDGQKIYSEVLLLDQVSGKNSGLYKLRIISENDDFEGEVMVDIVDNKVNRFQKFNFCEGDNILINSTHLGQFSEITWLNPEQKIISKSNTLELTNHSAGDYNYFLKTKKNGCENLLNIPISISPKPQFYLQIFEFSNNQVQLKIIGDLHNAFYEWGGSLGSSENTPNILIDKPKKGNYEYTCKIKQQSCEVIAKSSLEITD